MSGCRFETGGPITGVRVEDCRTVEPMRCQFDSARTCYYASVTGLGVEATYQACADAANSSTYQCEGLRIQSLAASNAAQGGER